MNLNNQSTLQLRKRKEEIDAVATFAAMNTNVPESMYTDLQQLQSELKEREQAYARHCNEVPVDSILNDWAAVGSEKSAQNVIEQLAIGCEPSANGAVSINPRNLYFDEIVLQCTPATRDLAKAKIVSARFNMRGAVSQQWIESKIGTLKPTSKQNAQQLKIYSARTAHGAGTSQVDFAFAEGSDGELVLRWAEVFV